MLAVHPSTTYQFEKIPTRIYENSAVASKEVAGRIASLIRHKAQRGEMAILGLATGSTPTGVYNELVRMHEEEGLSFQNVISFNLDEYYPMQPDALQSYHRFMNEYLFDRVDIKRENVHIPDGTLSLEEVDNYCQEYERKIDEAGGLDIQVLGIGRTGHIGFNEPGSSITSRTRMIALDRITIRDAASDFFAEENVPRRAITMGVGTIMKAKAVLLLAWGEGKAPIIKETVEGEISELIPATFLQKHDNAEILLDEAASAPHLPISPDLPHFPHSPLLIVFPYWILINRPFLIIFLNQFRKISIFFLQKLQVLFFHSISKFKISHIYG
ncbi:glucosamine-6-phosphate deaminase [Moorena bouillonii PNG]|uniref:Glucosamine-6-phosphate deaminase n=1 Tax=Moorena bouillonii PNG TaxID=568701 RepID=A0A1U7N1D6_9CYAN|nr:glucosamine-6-phosphate deaminase [Moorena bouillonii PNG]